MDCGGGGAEDNRIAWALHYNCVGLTEVKWLPVMKKGKMKRKFILRNIALLMWLFVISIVAGGCFI